MDELAKKLIGLDISDYIEYISKAELSILEKLDDYLRDLYFNKGNSVFSDELYDYLSDEIRSRGGKLKIGIAVTGNSKVANLPYWLGGTDKITPKDEDRFLRWRESNKGPYVISEKLDGVSCLATFKDGKISLLTRGDGEVGTDISYIADYLNLPKVDNITVRGELIITRNIFNAKYKDSYKNPRNMITGLLTTKTSRKEFYDINYVCYEIITGESEIKLSEQLKKLKSLNFQVAKHIIVSDISSEFLQKTLLEFKKSSLYDIDGLVVHIDRSYRRYDGGNPKYMFAFKMVIDDDIHETVVNKVSWNISRTGQIKPIVEFDPIFTGAITMSKCTGHTAKYILENKLGKGSIIRIIRSKDVIPYIIGIVKSTEADMPDFNYEWDANRVNIRITKDNDSRDQCIKVIEHFFDKMGIKFVKRATIEKLFDIGLNTMIKILDADIKTIMKAENIEYLSAERIYNNIHEGLKNVDIVQFLSATGIFGFGFAEKKLRLIFDTYPNILKEKKSRDELIKNINSIPGFATKTTIQFVDHISEANLLVKSMSKYVSFEEKKEEILNEDFKNMKIVLTGFRVVKINEGKIDVEEEIRKRGGSVSTSVSGSTNLVVAEDPDDDSSKLEKARKLGIKIISKKQFLREYLHI